MAAQLDYGYSTPKGVAGGKYDIAFDEVITRKNEEADGVLKYGMAAMVGTNAGSGVKVPATGCTADKIEGIVLRAANTEQDMGGHVVVKNNASVGIVRRGHVWGRIASDAVPAYGAKAYVVVTGEDAGTFTHLDKQTGEGTPANVDIGATFGNAKDDGITVIEIRM
jgi:hypothetical protein